VNQESHGEFSQNSRTCALICELRMDDVVLLGCLHCERSSEQTEDDSIIMRPKLRTRTSRPVPSWAHYTKIIVC